MAKEQKTSDDFYRTVIAPDLQLFYKPISATAMIKHMNHLLPKNKLYNLLDYIHQITARKPESKPELWREFWGILGKKINPTTRAVFQLDIALLKIEILILSKYIFNPFLSNDLNFKEIPQTKNLLIPAIWHRISQTQESFRIKNFHQSTI